MKITVASNSGFCFGVQNAVNALEKNLGENVYTLGEIIHNPTVVEHFKSKGVKVAESVDDIISGKVIIRSHGAAKEVFDRLSEKGVEVIDATCVFVKKIHEIVRKKHLEGFQIIIVGKASHPEVVGINGWCDNSAIILENEEQADASLPYEKVCVVCQTTFNEENYKKILKKIKMHSKIVEVFNTICYTTTRRQQEAEILSKTNDMMVVIGGKNSSNTSKLYEICKRHCERVVSIEYPDELDLKEIKGIKNIGVVAGASTPQGLIKEVFLKMVENQEAKNFMEGVLADMDMEKSNLKKGQRIVVTISDVKEDGLVLSVPGLKSDNIMSKDEVVFEGEFNVADYNVGDELEVKVVSTNPIKLSKRALAADEIAEQKVKDLVDDKKEFSMTFSELNKGGLTGKMGAYSIFVPKGQIRLGYITELDKYLNKPLRLEVTEFDAAKKKIVASQKIILEREKSAKEAEKAAKEAAFWDSISEGEIVEGKVVRISDFGAFVAVNGFDCLAHKSDISWAPVESIESVLEKNKVYGFKVLKVDKDAKKVSLGYKQLQPHPWESAGERYAVGSVVTGKVARIVPFGAFIELEKGIDGLVHVSQICHEWIENPESKLSVGAEIEAKVLEVDPSNQKITLSMKALVEAPERPERPKREKQMPTYAESQERVERKPREKKQRAERVEEEVSFWGDSETSSASIGDLFKGFNFDDEEK